MDIAGENKGVLLSVYGSLLDFFGPQGWWPADSAFEVIVGAVLTQATGWGNVEKAIGNLRREGILSPDGIMGADLRHLKKLIKPALYYNSKAKKLKNVVGFINERYGGNLKLMSKQTKDDLRSQLLGVWGVGPETADSILLYALDVPSFVVDAYTRRILGRLGLVGETIKYEKLKDYFESRLPEDVGLYKEYHALIVEEAKRYCRKKPACEGCPIKKHCGF